MTAFIPTAVPVGVDAHLLEICVHRHRDDFRPKWLGRDQVVRDALRTAYRYPEFSWSVTVTPPYPAQDIPSFTFALALGVLVCGDHGSMRPFGDVLVLGALRANGRLEGVSGVLPILKHWRRIGRHTVILPRQQEPLARLLDGLVVMSADTLDEAIALLSRSARPAPSTAPAIVLPPASVLARTVEQSVSPHVLRALETGAAGEHPTLLVGPTTGSAAVLARSARDFLPALTAEDAMAITTAASAATVTRELVTERPMRRLAHDAVPTDLVGDDDYDLGELALAHQGVLLLEDLSGFSQSVLECLAEHLRERELLFQHPKGFISRVPTAPWVVATLRPCPCGHREVAGTCRCTARDLAAYYTAVPSQLLDGLFDIGVAVRAWPPHAAVALEAGDCPATRVAATRARRDHRREELGLPLGYGAALQLDEMRQRHEWSPQEEARTRRVATTLADLRGATKLECSDIDDALAWRPSVALNAFRRPAWRW